ncbi:class I SAM-dependent methyltransferase [Rhodococcus kyotonensis]|uniref:Ubiquinone biosynthesis methyltransferase UbiE n=1 Tax=Rhodococcoides kyotonense TaxID=398843 RepID=A0A177Y971_9NOCA|nr:class I SAM-dependent methyltransferase [Rhodococcus kyotonensis]NIL76257.1 Demethylmenaquinone methyltransferase [Rhodococcus sp. B10]OAK51920.1 ubiquinone biosynthesis methyltransferase UbiE [Rhodococcus kyotonensis]
MSVGERGLPREQVPGAFDVGARAYDRLVGANPGYHEHLAKSAERLRLPGLGDGLTLLDIGCGTGASTAALLKAAPHATIVAADASSEMLEVARSKQWPPNVTFVHSRVEDLHENGVDGPFDGILAAYLIRNVDDPDTELKSLWSLLKPGASIAFHEYSVRDSRRAQALWSLVCWAVIIPLGYLATRDATLYKHLWRSVVTFDGATEFTRRMQRAGFTGLGTETMTGWQNGVVHTFLGARPSEIV